MLSTATRINVIVNCVLCVAEIKLLLLLLLLCYVVASLYPRLLVTLCHTELRYDTLYLVMLRPATCMVRHGTL